MRGLDALFALPAELYQPVSRAQVSNSETGGWCGSTVVNHLHLPQQRTCSTEASLLPVLPLRIAEWMGAFEDGVEDSADCVSHGLWIIDGCERGDRAPEVEQQMDEISARLAVALYLSAELGDVQLMSGHTPACVPEHSRR
ncbi:MAG: hypothetical protein WB698_07510 [Solirubrobacteraceae bacterium]